MLPNVALQVSAEGRRAYLNATGLTSATVLAASGLTNFASAEDTIMQPKTATSADVSTLPRVTQTMVDPPFFPSTSKLRPPDQNRRGDPSDHRKENAA